MSAVSAVAIVCLRCWLISLKTNNIYNNGQNEELCFHSNVVTGLSNFVVTGFDDSHRPFQPMSSQEAVQMSNGLYY